MSYDELQSWLTDVKYAMQQIGRADSACEPSREDLDMLGRAYDGLERVRNGIESACKRIKPKTHAAQLDKPT